MKRAYSNQVWFDETGIYILKKINKDRRLSFSVDCE